MKQIIIIAAVGSDLAIGRGGDLAYHISADLKRFKALTMGHPVIMGRKTFESFPNGPLPGRRNIVITRNAGYSAPGIETVASLEAALALTEGDDVFVIGGGEIYRQAMPLATRLELTLVDSEMPDADTWFPPYDGAWTLTDSSEMQTCPRTGLAYRFATLVR